MPREHEILDPCWFDTTSCAVPVHMPVIEILEPLSLSLRPHHLHKAAYVLQAPSRLPVLSGSGSQIPLFVNWPLHFEFGVWSLVSRQQQDGTWRHTRQDERGAG